MEIKKILKNISNFIIKRFIELFGLLISVLSILFLISLLSYSPEDPNFIFPDNTEIKNLLGFRGSFVSDLFLQSLGLISILISITLFFTGANIIKTKKILIILQNSFYLIIYSIIGAFFFTIYYPESFWLSINGNGGFIGKLLNETFLVSIVNLNKKIAYYILILIIIFIFLKSVNFNILWFFNLIKNFFSKKEKNKVQNENGESYEDKSLSYSTQIQEDLPFVSSENKTSKKKFKLPSIDFLKSPTKTERSNDSNEENIDKEFLEKILLDFGVEGKIKKVSNGPVVSLNEFEPAPGIKPSFSALFKSFSSTMLPRAALTM